MNKSALAVLVGASASIYSSFSLSQTDEDLVVVTANRFAQKNTSVLASTTIITKEEINKLQVNSALDVLKTLAGVEVASSGGKAQDTSIYIRGTGSSHTLVLLDGVKINSLTSGGSSIGLVPAFAIEKIEVIRGPRAAAYGSDAIGGVISITTSDDFQTENKAAAGYGSDNHSLLGWKSAGHINDSTRGEFIVSQEKSDGYKVVDSAPDGDEHGYKAQSYIGHIRSDLSDNWLLQLSGYKQESHSDYDSSGVKNRSDDDVELLSGLVRYYQDQFSSELQLSYYSTELKSGPVNGSSAKSIIKSHKNTVTWLNGLSINNMSHVQLGFEYSQDNADLSGSNASNYDNTKKNIKSAFITSSSDINDFTFELSGRYDDSSSFGSHSTWNTGVGYWLTDSIQLLGSYGTSYKEPTFNDLFWPGQGNPNLKPEKARSREIGLRGEHDLLSWEVTAFRNDLRDMIDWGDIGGGVWLPDNVSRARIDGIEVNVDFDTGPIENKLQLSWKDPKDAMTNSQLDKRARHNYSWTMIYAKNKWSGSVVTNYTGKRISGGTWLDSYVTLDTGVKYQASRHLSVGVKLNNLFNEHYETGYSPYNGYYRGDERTVFAEMGYLF